MNNHPRTTISDYLRAPMLLMRGKADGATTTRALATILGGSAIISLIAFVAIKTIASSPTSDNASAGAYTGGNFNGQDGDGAGGFGAWQVTPTANGANSGAFIGSSVANGTGCNSGNINSTGNKSWGLYGNGGAQATAVRTFPGALVVGQSFTIDMDNGFVGGSYANNFVTELQLNTSSGTMRWGFHFRGGAGEYQMYDSSSTTFERGTSGLGFTDGGLRIVFTLTGTDTYSVNIFVPATAGSPTRSFTGTLAGATGFGIDRVTLIKRDINGGCNYDAYWNNMSIGPCPTIGPITATSNSPVCQFQNLTLFATTIAGASYSWTGPNGFTHTAQNPTINFADLAAAGTYTVVATVNGCSSAPASTTVTINPRPGCGVTAPNGGWICAGESITLFGSGSGGTPPYTYFWTGPGGFTATTQNITVSPTVQSMYTVVATDAKGCSSGGCGGTVNVIAPPTCTVSPASATICTGNTQVFTANATGSGGPYSYSWSGPGGFTATTQSITVGTAGTYTCTVTDLNPYKNCTTSCSATLTVTPAPATTASATPNPACIGQNVTLSATGDAGDSYSWSGPGGFSSTQQNPVITNVQLAQAGSYTVTRTAAGCPAVNAGVNLAVTASPTCSITGPDPVCRFSTAVYQGPAGMTSYAWSIISTPGGSATISGAANQQSVTIDTDGSTSFTVGLTIVDANGCTNTCNKVVSTDTIAPTITMQPTNLSVCVGQTASFSVAATDGGVGGLSYMWRKRGTGWGAGGWQFPATSGTASRFIGSSTDNNAGGGSTPPGNINTAGKAWGLFNSGGLTEAIRPLNGSIAVGDTFTIDMDNGGVQAGGTAGFGLRNSAGENRFEVFFVGGESTYRVKGDGASVATTIAFTRQGLRIQMKLTGPDTYSVTITRLTDSVSQTLTGTLGGTAGTAIDRVRLFNANAGGTGGPDNNLYFNSIGFDCRDDNAGNYTTWTAGSDLGNAPLANGGNIAGANTATLQISNAQLTDAGFYDVCVFDACQNLVTANAATLTVNALASATITAASPVCPNSTGNTASVPNAGGGATYVWTISAGNSITAGQNTPTITYTAGSAGAITIGVTITANGCVSTGSATVQAQDNIPPTITCPAAVNVQCASAVPAPNPASVTTSDNCPGTVTVAHVGDVISSQTCPNRYTITRTYSATDASGNLATCAQTITVNDTTAPLITCPAPVSVNTDPGQCYATGVTLGTATATDNCGGTPTITNNAPTQFPKGNTQVTWTATDACGNTATCVQTVTVTDNEKPAITCPVNITTNSCTALVVTYATPTPSDNCPGATASCSPASGSTFPAGTTTVTCTATDVAGNTTNCTFTVNVTLNTSPSISAQPQNVAACTGSTATFNVTASGTGPLSYFWRKRSTGWGATGWQLNSTGAAGFFVGTSAGNDGGDTNSDGDINTSGKAWGLFANSGGLAEAIRPFNGTLAVGQTFSIDVDTGYIQNGGTVGFGLRDASNGNILEFFFTGGGTDYRIKEGAAASYGTAIPFTGEGLRVRVTLTSATTYSMTITRLVNGAVFGPFIGNLGAGGPIDRVRLFNSNAGPGASNDAFFNSISYDCKDDNAAAYTTATWTTGSNLGNAPITGAPDSPSYTIASVTPSDAGSYDVCIVNVCGSVTSTAATLTVNPLPTCSITGSSGPVCPNSTTSYSAPAGMASYSWTVSGDATGSSSSQNISVTAGSVCNGSFTLSLTIVDSSGCTNTCTKTVTVSDTVAPVLTAGTVAACYPDTASAEAAAIAATSATDNCGGAVTKSASTSGTCTATITVTGTDACGNSSSVTFTTRIDGTAPTVTAGTIAACYSTQAAAEAAAIAATSATDNCPGTLTTTASTSGNCSATITVTVTDGCGNAASVTYNTRIDNTAPIVTAGTVNACYSTKAAAEAAALAATTATDNCSAAGALTKTVSTAGNCAAIVTVTVTDECGNSASVNYNLRVDGAAPTVTAGSISACYPTVASAEAAALAATSATDNCTANPTLTASTSGTCSAVVTVTATDECGNATSVTYNTRIDNTAPVLTGVPANATVECDAVPAAATVTATDNCDGSVTVNFNETSAPGSCPQNYTLTRTWTALDTCGNTVGVSQTITVQDTKAPAINCPASVTIDCNASTDPSNTGSATATDNCGSVTIAHSDSVAYLGCPVSYDITRTWTATDQCGNSSTCTQIVSVRDTTAPVIAGVGANATSECPATPSFSSPTATDDCNLNPTLTFNDVTTPGSCAQSYSVTRTWTATDACGNSSSAAQTITVQDTTAPSLAGQGGNATIQCPATPSFTAPTASDACDNVPVITFSDVTTPGSCTSEYSVTRTWVATDACGNASAPVSQTISVKDTTAPTISGVGANTTIECPATPSFSSPTATDACDASPSLTFSDVTTPGSCANAYSVKRTWTATDACGNSSTATQTITVADTTAPTLSGHGANATIQCPATPSFTAPTASDDCDTAPSISFTDTTTPGTCAGNYSVKRTWTATDCSGHASAPVSQTITVADTKAPTLTKGTIGTCFATQGAAEAAAIAATTASDSCGGAVTKTASTSGTCSATITVTGTDACGNLATVTYSTRIDGTAPAVTKGSIASCYSTQAAAEAAALAATTATDNCPGTLTKTVATTGTCSASIVVTVTDGCGNAASATYSTKIDSTAPVLNGVPAAASYSCYSAVPAPAAVTATDNCDTSVTVTYSQTQSNPGSSCSNIVTRTWSAMDSCGNTTTSNQVITVNDATAPVISSCPAAVTVQCASLVPTPNTASVTATDNCGGTVTITHVGDVISGQTCPNRYTITRTYRAADVCGNSSTCTQTITVNDTTPPVLSGCPANVMLQVGDPLPPVANVSATDNCGGSVTMNYSQTGHVITPRISVYTRTWTATDSCGNSSSCTQTISVGSNCALTQGYWKNHPEMWPVTTLTVGCVTYTEAQMLTILETPPRGDVTYILIHQLIATKLALAQGANGSCINSTVTQSDAYLCANPLGSNPQGSVRDQGTLLYPVLDNYNNGRLCVPHCQDDQNTLPPQFDNDDNFWNGVTGNPVPTQTVIASSNNCVSVYTLPLATSAYDWTADGQLRTVVTGSPASGTVIPVGTNIVTVTGVDPEGHTITTNFVLVVRDITPPAITCPANKTVTAPNGTCQATVSVGTATAIDNCSTSTILGTRSDGLALNSAYPIGITMITWTATDKSGNTSTCTQTVTVNPGTLPAKPATPTGLTANPGKSKVDLSWTAVSGVSVTYSVKRATVSGGPYTIMASGLTSTSYTDTTVVNGTTYFYVVSAVNCGGESANSTPVSVTPPGKVRWMSATGAAIETQTTVGPDGTVYVGNNGNKVIAVNPDGTVKWTYTLGGTPQDNLALCGNVLYVGATDKKLYALNASTGALQWSYVAGNTVNGTTCYASGGVTNVHFTSDDKNVYSLKDNGPSATLVWKRAAGGPVRTIPAVSADGSTVYAGSDDKKLYALNRSTGAVTWSYTATGMIKGGPSLAADGTIYFVTNDKKLYAINPTGTLKWSYTGANNFNNISKADTDGTIYSGNGDGKLYAFNPTGTVKWSYAIGASVVPVPLISSSSNLIYVGTSNNSFYAMNKDGTLNWSKITGGTILSAAAESPLDGSVYAGNSDGSVYAYEP